MNVLLIDEHLGRRLRQRRRLLGRSQTAVGRACGTTFQQIQKYEAGQASMSAHRLWRVAAALEVPIDYFFEGLRGDVWRNADTRPEPEETAAVVHAFDRMRDKQRRRFLDLALALVGGSEPLARLGVSSARGLHVDGQ